MTRLAAAALAAALGSSIALAQPSTAFFYQGQLRNGGTLVNGTADIRARLFDAAVGGSQVGTQQIATNVQVTDGTFTAPFDFGTALGDADNLFLELDVRTPAGAGAFTTLSPRQPVRPAPVAVRARAARSQFDVLNPAGDATITMLGDRAGQGAAIQTFSEDGAFQTRLESDVTGEGVFMVWHRNNLSPGLVFDGNSDGLGNPLLSFEGSATAVVFDLSATGNSVVQLPTNAISSTEMLNEPGVANNQVASVALGGTNTVILSRTITVPAPGFVLVLAQGDIQILHTTGTSSIATFGVADNPTTLGANQDIQMNLPAGAPSGIWDSSAAAHGLFSVASAGNFTYYFLGRDLGGAGTMFDANLTLIYFPTSYGLTVPNLPDPSSASGNDDLAARPGLTPAELAAERHAAEAFAQERLLDEMSRMREELDRLRAMVRRSMQEQAAAHGPTE